MPQKNKQTDPVSWRSINDLAKQQLAYSKKMLAAANKHLREVKKHTKQIDAYIKAFKEQQRLAEAKRPNHQFFIAESDAEWIGKTIWNWKLKNFLISRTAGDSTVDPAPVTIDYADDLNLISSRSN